MQKLGRAQFVVSGKSGQIGSGQRPSGEKGAGIEFVDHRPYEPGDDLRYLDVIQYSRRREFMIRQYVVERALPITILLDATESMDYGTPSKFEYARTLCEALAFIGLAGGDVVQLATWQGGQLNWSQRVQGRGGAERLFTWLEQAQCSGGAFDRALPQLRQLLDKNGLLIVVSDWWDGAALEATLRLRARQHVLAVQTLSPDELEPSFDAHATLRLVDSESGQEVDLTVDADALDSYRDAVAQWRQDMQQSFVRAGARLATLRTDEPIEQALLIGWRRSRLIA
ncbi:MAG TPA: DUF58 domain-containing protein [Devosiaceae bacterium]